MTVKYGLRGVPAVVVNGKYLTAPYFVRNQKEMFDVLDYLVEKELAGFRLKQDTAEKTIELPN